MNTVSIPTIADACMLVYVRVGVWSARKLDKKQTQKTIHDAGATDDAARVNKHLLANADAALKEVQRKGNAIRDYIEANTLPWDDAGNRLVTNARALTMVGELHALEQKFWQAVDDFVQQYPLLRAQAVANLGDMGADEDYPQPDVVRSKFHLKISFSPVAKNFGDVRQGMSQQQAQAWQNAFEVNVSGQVESAIKAAWLRLRESLERYSDRLLIDDAEKRRVFRDTMVEQLRQTTSLLQSLNVFGNAELDRIANEVNRDIACFDADVLRTNTGVAMATKARADEILARMRGFLAE